MPILDQSQSWQYIRDNPDLLQQFELEARANPNTRPQDWANQHYALHGQAEGRQIPNSVSTEQVLGWPTYSNATAQGMGMLSTGIDPTEQARRQTQADDAMYRGQYADYLQAMNGAQAGYNDALKNALTPEEWQALQAVQLNEPIMWLGTDNGAIGANAYQVDPRQYLQQRFGSFDINQIAQAKGVPLMPTLDQGNQQAKPYNDYLESLKTLRSQIPTPTPSFPTASPISSGTVMQAPMMTPQSPLTTNQPQITYPTVGDSSAWQAQNAVQTPMQQRMSANGMLYS